MEINLKNLRCKQTKSLDYDVHIDEVRSVLPNLTLYHNVFRLGILSKNLIIEFAVFEIATS